MTLPKYVFWGHQQPFWIYTQGSAKTTFDLLDPRLKPRVFLLGFGLTGARFEHPIGTVGDDCPYPAATFSSLLPEIEQLGPLLPKGPVLLPYWSRVIDQALPRRLLGISQRVEQVLDAHPDSAEWVSRASLPVRIHDYLVLAVLQVDRATLLSYPRLEKTVVDEVSVERSLIDAVANAFLETCSHELSVSEPGKSQSCWRTDPAEIVRAGGRRLMVVPIVAAGRDEDPSGLFANLNAISSLSYEGQAAAGRLVLARKGHENLSTAVTLRAPIGFDDPRAVRKLVQLSSECLSLLSDADSCYGLGTIRGTYDPQREDLFEIAFVRRHSWRLCHRGTVLMQVTYGEPRLFRAEFPTETLRSALRLIPGLSEAQGAKLMRLAETVAREPHGSMLVISPCASADATRLGSQSTAIDPCELSEPVLEQLTRIDGALLADPDSVCHAIGVILDGRATEHGTRSRGARFNSAVRYAQDRKESVIIMVKSEDGMIDIITKQAKK